MLKVGDKAPEIDAVGSDGKRFILSKQDGLCTVIYFFPKAFTPGCTGETKRFRDNYAEIALAGAAIVGISTDDNNTQCRFAESLRAPFPMIGDHDQKISAAFGVLWPIVGLTRRVTFVIGPDRMILAVFRHEINIQQHRDDVLRFINEKFLASRPRAVRRSRLA
jgi:thioredoxin-dependent peroxiredoxin